MISNSELEIDMAWCEGRIQPSRSLLPHFDSADHAGQAEERDPPIVLASRVDRLFEWRGPRHIVKSRVSGGVEGPNPHTATL